MIGDEGCAYVRAAGCIRLTRVERWPDRHSDEQRTLYQIACNIDGLMAKEIARQKHCGTRVVSRFVLHRPVPSQGKFLGIPVEQLQCQRDWGQDGLVPFNHDVWYRLRYVNLPDGHHGINVYVANLTLREVRTRACRSACIAFLHCLGKARRRGAFTWDLCLLVTRAAWETRRDTVWGSAPTE